MKSLFTVALIALSAQAFAATDGLFLNVYSGKLSKVNGNFSCTYVNTTGADLDVKRVQFNLERNVGKERDIQITKSVNNVLYSGETLTVASGMTDAVRGDSCLILARK